MIYLDRCKLFDQISERPATGVGLTKSSLRIRKHQLVRDAIYDAAIELFEAKGFDETTVEEVAQAAGVSRASFFRYFSSKDDLLAQNVIKYGDALTAAIKASPPSSTPLEIMRETVLAVAKETANSPHTRQVIDISLRSGAAAQAHMSRLREVEGSVATAFAERIGSSSKDEIEPRLLAIMTLSAMNVAVLAWHRGDSQELSDAVEQVFSRLTQIVCDQKSSKGNSKGTRGPDGKFTVIKKVQRNV
jgi:AcrR family transcriptional regulator